MTDICFYFQVHQPIRLRRVRTFGQPAGHDYWDHKTNQEIFDRAAYKCYLPANQLILDAIQRTHGAFRVAYSLSGVFLEHAERHRPDVIESFRALARTGHVEFLGETYYHSLAGLWDDPKEFATQVEQHRQTIRRLFDIEPITFRNTELIYDDRTAKRVEDLGFEAMLTEGTERILGTRNPNHLYRPNHEGLLKVLLKNYRLSDDMAFRFSSHDWVGFPLTAPKFAQWLADAPGDTINLFMDYETFGEHQWSETGIFDFLRHLPEAVTDHPHLRFALPREVARNHEPIDTIVVPHAISWADTERDVSAWLHNKMQHACFNRLRDLAPVVETASDPELTHAWRLLQTSDHLYYACTKNMNDGDIHSYFSPYESPYLGFINHKAAIEDLAAKAEAQAAARKASEPRINVKVPSPPAPTADKNQRKELTAT